MAICGTILALVMFRFAVGIASGYRGRWCPRGCHRGNLGL